MPPLKQYLWTIGRLKLYLPSIFPFFLNIPLLHSSFHTTSTRSSLYHSIPIKMSFFDEKESFFLDATASTHTPIVEIVPLNDTEVFQYLDANLDALYRYLEERGGAAVSFIGALAKDLGVAATEKVATSVTGEQVVAEDNSVTTLPPVAADEQAVVEEDDDDDEVVVIDGLPEDNWASDEEVSQAGPEDHPRHASKSPLPRSPSTPPISPISPPPPSRASPSPSPSSSSSSSSSPSLPSLQPPSSSLPFPAPANLVEASKKEPEGKKWRLFEEESCIGHMIDIRDEGYYKGEERFKQAQLRMASLDGINKGGQYSVKNFWNRVGRHRSGFDERKNRKAPLATSQQTKGTKPAARKSPAQSKSKATLKRATANTKNKRKAIFESSSDEDSESDYSVHSEDSNPPPKSRKRDRDDSEDEYELDQATINAVSKGLRTKKARIVY